MSASKMLSLESVLLSTATAGEPEIKLALNRLSSELKDRLRRAPSASSEVVFASAMRALSRIRGGANADARMACLFDCACFFYANDIHSGALAAVRSLDALARQAQIRPWIRKAEAIGGVIHADLGNVVEGIVRLSNALGIARELGDPAAEISALNNLGAALAYGGLFKDAIRCTQRAVVLARAHADNPLVIELSMELTALTNMAQSYYYLKDFESGYGVISACLAKCTEPTNAISAVSRSVREFNYVLLALELGRIDSARERLVFCRKYAELGGTRSLALADIAAGLYEVYGGDVDKGLGLLEDSLKKNSHAGVLRTDAILALVTALDQVGQPQRALGYIRQVLDEIRLTRQKAALVLISSEDKFEMFDSQVISEFDDLAALKLTEANLRARSAEHEVINTRIETLERLAITADLKEDASGEHGYRVGRWASMLAQELGWSREACHALELAARLHDIGKVGMPDSILLKSGHLAKAERTFLNVHTTVGAELLSQSGMPHFRLAEEVARFHHEWWNGTGYPSQLSRNRIPIHARIVAIADVFDALTHGRPYADAWPNDRALEEIRVRRGTQFDPQLSDHFIAIVERLQEQNEDLDLALRGDSRGSILSETRNHIRRLLAEGARSLREESTAKTTSLSTVN